MCLREANGSILSKNIFYTYGAHNLSNVVGMHAIINNQTGCAGWTLCRGYNGTDCGAIDRVTGEWPPSDLTRTNSVLLVR